MGDSSLAALQKAKAYIPPEAASEGTATLVIKKLTEKTDKNSEPYFLLICGNQSSPECRDIMANLNLPIGNEWDDMRSEVLAKFARTFGIDDITVLATDPTAVLGNTDEVHLSTEEYQGAIVNKIQTWL